MKILKSPQIRSLFIALPLSLVFASCARTCTESALSDIVIDDPGLLIVEMTLEKEVKPFGGMEARIWVRDKNEQALTLKNGGVSINGRELSIRKSLVNKLPSYRGGSGVLKLDAGERYDIQVMLGDGSEYVSSLVIPENNIELFDAPSEHDGSKGLTLNWNSINSEYETVLTWRKRISADTTHYTMDGEEIIKKVQTTRSFDSSFFRDERGRVEEIDFTLETKISGEVHSDFRSESFLKCMFVAPRTVKIIESNPS